MRRFTVSNPAVSENKVVFGRTASWCKWLLGAILILALTGDGISQQTTTTIQPKSNKIKKLSPRKPARISISFLGGFSYVLSSANGDGGGFRANYINGTSTFTSSDLGMQQGYGAMFLGRFAINKKRSLRITGNIGYNFFYNKFDSKLNRTMWNVLNIGPGIEYNFAPKEKERLFVGAELNYSLMFGAWQSNITYPDGFVSNIYTKFKPASRFGAAITTGMEFKLSRRLDLVVAVRGVWSNIFPKQNYTSAEAYSTYLNDSSDKNGIVLNGKKDVFFLQLVTGLTLPISYR